ncbi:MAG TPA: hypothetical protein VFY87_23230 [Geminicoccaceae bacterium]|nr:hypothetical protein [Geminicoccaceae bacterium]
MPEKWTVKGRVVVDHLLPELKEAFGEREGVPGAVVKVSARSKIPTGWGWWSSWGKVTTGADGRFSVSENHGGDRRQFRVEVLFDSDRLRLKEGQETSIRLDGNGFPLDVEFDLTDKDWFEVHHDEKDGAANGRQAGTIDLGDLPVTGAVAHRLADIWCLYDRVMDLLESYGPAYRFAGRVVVKYPMGIAGNSPASSSYNNPFTRSLYIKEGQFTTRTLLHELFHQWDFDHSTGEDAMAWQLAKHGTTHQTRENTTFVPFREAFADWAAHKLLKEITDGRLLNFKEDVAWKYPDLPLSRSYVGAALVASERRLANVDFTERGWQSLFNILTIPYLDRCDFNRTLTPQDVEFAFYALFTSNSCPEVRLAYTLQQVLSVWLKYPGKGIDSFMDNSDLDFFHFLGRAGAVLPEFEDEKIKMVKTCLDPNSTDNPCPG